MANYTPNYQLHQWEPEDPFLRTDFNTDLTQIDTVLGELSKAEGALKEVLASHTDTLSEYGQLLPMLGNCQVHTTTYAGNGQESHTLAFPKPLKALFVVLDLKHSSMIGDINYLGIYILGGPYVVYGRYTGAITDVVLEENQKEITFTNNMSYKAMNYEKATYTAVALLAADE